jgi:hypothetical protein
VTPELETQLDQTPPKERKELLRNHNRPLLETLSRDLPEDEPIQGIASAYLTNTGQNGILAYTPRKLIFGSWMDSSWRTWLWEEVDGVRAQRPRLGAVELFVTVDSEIMKFHFGLDKGDSKDWVGPMCTEITMLAGRSQLGR